MASPTGVAHTRTVAVLLAGGTGSRFGTAVPKQLLDIAGRPLIEHTIAAFDSSPEIDEVLVVMVPGFTTEVERIVEAGGYRKVSRVVEGGASRTESTYLALTALAGEDSGSRLLLHDAVRPLVSHRIIGECARALRTREAVTVAVPSSDTVLVVDEQVISRIPSRAALRRAQTPQGFRLGTIRRAYDLAMSDPSLAATDDCAVVLNYLPDVPIHVVPGSEDNIKVTHADDIVLAEALLRRDRGSGRPAGAVVREG